MICVCLSRDVPCPLRKAITNRLVHFRSSGLQPRGEVAPLRRRPAARPNLTRPSCFLVNKSVNSILPSAQTFVVSLLLLRLFQFLPCVLWLLFGSECVTHGALNSPVIEYCVASVVTELRRCLAFSRYCLLQGMSHMFTVLRATAGDQLREAYNGEPI